MTSIWEKYIKQKESAVCVWRRFLIASFLPISFGYHLPLRWEKEIKKKSYIYLINQVRGPYWENIGPRS